MGIPETHERAPETQHHDFGVGSLMYFAHCHVENEFLKDAHRHALRLVTEDELLQAEFEPIRKSLRGMQDTDPDDERYLLRQAELAAGILALSKWDKKTREILAWIAIRVGTLNHGFSFRSPQNVKIRDSATKLVQSEPHEMFAEYPDASSLHRLLERVFVRSGPRVH
ncbi:hypothetical protein MT349_19625 [Rathayibacter caricis]|uniref:hypothetical protein n=1 Tax=Rathayibacter caricis TaxID=110936 RepID=UPI001FB4A53B|nr:hypothetical protein [Rathayibacter caricis]MCJ1697999.1 hypothetical protein [Rathayibacter caricis]